MKIQLIMELILHAYFMVGVQVQSNYILVAFSSLVLLAICILNWKNLGLERTLYSEFLDFSHILQELIMWGFNQFRARERVKINSGLN